MGPFLSKLKEQGLSFVRGLSRAARIMSVLALLGVIGGLAYIVGVDHTKYATLYTGLASDDAAQIVERLKKEHIPYRLERGGAAIAVPVDRVHEQRLRLAGAGLPRGGGVGFEIFDKQKLGVSDFAQQVNYRRALQGGFERTISQIDAIKSARVHLAMPRRQLFARAQRPVSASITVRLRAGRALGKSAVRAVVHLVSSAVSGLKPQAISVMDTHGRLLWRGKEGDGSRLVEGFLDFRQKVERSLEERVAEILDRALGPGHSVVKVTADMVMSSSEQTEERFDPERVAVRSESKAEEKNVSAGPKTAGVAGVAGNLPGAAGAKSSGQGSDLRSKRLTRNYEVSKTVRRQHQPAGAMRRLSVAVLVDQAALSPGVPPSSKDESGSKAGAALATVDLKALELVVQQAVGYTPSRGDVVTLKAVPFAVDAPLAREVPPPLWRRVATSPWPYVAVVALIVLIILLLVWRRSGRGQTDLVPLPATVRGSRRARRCAQRHSAPIRRRSRATERAIASWPRPPPITTLAELPRCCAPGWRRADRCR